MIRIPATGVMLDADDLATVRAALRLAEAACQTTLGGDPHLSSIRGRADVFGQPGEQVSDVDVLARAKASLARLERFGARLEEVGR
jgi:hypothetical protein